MISKICGCVQSLLHTDLYNSSPRFVPSANWSLRVCFWPNACFWCPGLHRSLFQWIVRVSSKFNTRRTFVDLLINSLLLWSPTTGPLIVCTATVSKELIVKKEHFILKYKSSCTNKSSGFSFYTRLLDLTPVKMWNFSDWSPELRG